MYAPTHQTLTHNHSLTHLQISLYIIYKLLYSNIEHLKLYTSPLLKTAQSNPYSSADLDASCLESSAIKNFS